MQPRKSQARGESRSRSSTEIPFFLLLLSTAIASNLPGTEAASAESRNTTFHRIPLSIPLPNAQSTSGFEALSPTSTGVRFTNRLEEADALRNQNLTLGSGVVAGDYDGDGRCDLYFCSITGRNALYRNLGDWRFEDVTDRAGVALAGQTNTGAVFVDLDGDRDLDLLVSSLGHGVRLLANQGDGTFREITRDAGLSAPTGSLTLAVADADGDGDLDLYVCNYGAMALLRSGDYQVRMVKGQLQVRGANSDRIRVIDNRLVELGEADALFLNYGRGTFTKASWNSATFIDAQGKPMPAPLDFGLSAQWRDVNGDGAPDLYVCNDFETRDRFWLNDGRGHFRETSPLVTRCESYSSMGVDFADLDRDGHLDFLVVEMLSPDHRRRLSQQSPMRPTSWPPGELSDRTEVPRNTLFHARGDGTYEEIAYQAGVAASDWSWQGSLVDVDLDGYEDLLVVNGHLMDLLDLDAEENAQDRRLGQSSTLRRLGPGLYTPNRAFRNQGDLTFRESSDAWGFADTNICHGLALADLDNDGDLDAIINRLNAPAALLRNQTAAPRVAVRLRGRSPNTEGLGAEMVLRAEGVLPQSRTMTGGGKYLSHDQTVRVFAVPSHSPNTTQLEVTWRSGRRTILRGIEPGFLYEVEEPTNDAVPAKATGAPQAPRPWFTDATAALAHQHHETAFDDFSLQPLLPRKFSQRGPGVCVMDLNEDGHEDVALGTGRGGSLAVRWGNGRGAFRSGDAQEPAAEDILGLAGWFAKPSDPTLLSAMAVYETASAPPPMPLQRHHWDGIHLTTQAAASPDKLYPKFSLASCLAVADFDADGDLDVFLGAHSLAGRYPMGGPSQMLRNQNGVLELDRTNAPTLLNLGAVNSALWTDLDRDGWPELVVACEWGSLRLFRNEHGRLSEATVPSGLAPHTGWWTGLASADVNSDGWPDLIAGNWGWNSPCQASPAQPQIMFFGDLMNRQVMDLIETEYDPAHPGLFPARPLQEIGPALPILPTFYSSHRAWASSTIQEILGPYPNTRSVSAVNLATTVFLNHAGTFEARPLPNEAQRAPVWGVVAADFDGDTACDLFLSQNFFAVRPGQDRRDAGRGLLLRGDGEGGFTAVPGQASGLILYGDQRGAAVGDFNEDGKPDLVVGQNAGATRLFLNQNAKAALRVRLQGPSTNPTGIGAAIALETDGKMGIEQQVHGTSGWLSQNSAVTLVPLTGTASSQLFLKVRWPGGKVSHLNVPAGAKEVTVVSSDN